MAFLPKSAADQFAGGGGGNYLNPSKLHSGASFRFALLDDEPLEMFEVWGESNSRWQAQAFPFLGRAD